MLTHDQFTRDQLTHDQFTHASSHVTSSHMTSSQVILSNKELRPQRPHSGFLGVVITQGEWAAEFRSESRTQAKPS